MECTASNASALFTPVPRLLKKGAAKGVRDSSEATAACVPRSRHRVSLSACARQKQQRAYCSSLRLPTCADAARAVRTGCAGG
jgi:hypothetical protein